LPGVLDFIAADYGLDAFKTAYALLRHKSVTLDRKPRLSELVAVL
jgi:hypothetical protein